MFIEYGDLISCSIDRVGDLDVFRFSGGSGDVIFVGIRRVGDAFSCLRIFDPDGLVVDRVSCGERDYVLEKTGTYTILVEESSSAPTQYAFVLERLDPIPSSAVPLEFNQIVDDEVNGIGDADVFFFFGQADDTVRIRIVRRGEERACLKVYGPDRMFVGRTNCGAGDFLLTQTGTHAIIVTGLLGRIAQYTITIVCIDGICEGPNLRRFQVAGCLNVKGAPVGNQTVRLTQPDEVPQTKLTDIRGCFDFNVVQEKPFDVQVVNDDLE